MSNDITHERKADAVIQQSKSKFSGTVIIFNSEVKVWKAMFAILFVAGFVAAIAFMAGLS